MQGSSACERAGKLSAPVCSGHLFFLLPQVSYQTALGAVFVEGWIFVILAVTGVRLRLIRLVPKSIMLATSAGAAVMLSLPPAQGPHLLREQSCWCTERPHAALAPGACRRHDACKKPL